MTPFLVCVILVCLLIIGRLCWQIRKLKKEITDLNNTVMAWKISFTYKKEEKDDKLYWQIGKLKDEIANLKGSLNAYIYNLEHSGKK